MNKFLVILLLTGLCASGQEAKKKGNVITGTADAAKMVLAKQKLLAGEYVSALNLYREVHNNNPSDPAATHYVGVCQYHLKKYDEAKKYLERAVAMPGRLPQSFLYLGMVLKAEENFPAAVEAFTNFKNAGGGSDEENQEGDLLLSHCNNAIAMMNAPLPVKIENLGPAINSKYDDKNPCITADGASLIFTTRRPRTTNSPVDVDGDGKYFEDIYISHRDSAGRFSTADDVSRTVNTDGHDACTSVSPDGKQIFIYKNDLKTRSARGGNVFVSKVANGKWRKPEPLEKPINLSASWEGGACVSPDGKTYFFTSEREGGFGNSDIWMVRRKNKHEWEKPVNLGSSVNTPYDEAGMFLAPDGKTLFFCSDGPRSMGSYDIFRTIFEDGHWSEPENLGYPINTPAKEGQLSLSADASYAYLSSERKGGLGESDLYRVDLQQIAILEKDFRSPRANLCILKGTIREGNEGYTLSDVDITVKNELGAEFNTYTGDAGEYFYTLKPGKYTLTVAKKGYETISEEVLLTVPDRGTAVVEKGYLLKRN